VDDADDDDADDDEADMMTGLRPAWVLAGRPEHT